MTTTEDRDILKADLHSIWVAVQWMVVMMLVVTVMVAAVVFGIVEVQITAGP